MDIGDFLIAVAHGYDRDDMRSPGHELLNHSRDYFEPLLPAGLKVTSGGGKGKGTFTPWVAVLDPDETDSPQRGIYLVYLFSQDLRTVWLSLNQGITDVTKVNGQQYARAQLGSDASVIRAALGVDTSTFGAQLELKSKGYRQRAYEAGNIVAKRYDIADMPSAEDLENDLDKFVRVYQEAIALKRSLSLERPGTINSASAPEQIATGLLDFKPKSDSDYIQHLHAQEIVKSRRHESLVRQYGVHLISLGQLVTTKVHPRDLVVTAAGVDWLVEAKVLYRGNSTNAVREVLGQLATYEYFLYPNRSANKLALFTEPIGDAYVDLLETHSISSVWKGELSWEGSTRARDAGLY